MWSQKTRSPARPPPPTVLESWPLVEMVPAIARESQKWPQAGEMDPLVLGVPSKVRRSP